MKRGGKAVAWGAAACLLGMGTPARAGEGPAPVIRLGGTNHTASLVLFVGVEKGIFLKNGVVVKLRIFGTGPEMTKALQAGELDITPTAVTNLPVALERGLQVKSLVYMLADGTSTTHDNMMGIVVRPGVTVERLADLGGKKMGVTLGGTGDLYVTAALLRAGVARGAVGYVNVPPGSMVAAWMPS